MTFKKIITESPVGKVGRTSSKEADNHITPELEKEFLKIVKKLGGKLVVGKILNKVKPNPEKDFLPKDINTSVTISKAIENIQESKEEDLLIKNNIKIKKKFSTKFGTEFILAKKYDEDDIKKILKQYRVTFDGDSIFVS